MPWAKAPLFRHAVCDAKGRPLVLLLTPGNVHDCKVAQRCIEAMPPAAELVADKGYDSKALRDWLAERRTTAVISAFVDHYNNQRYHESIGSVTPADAYFGRHTVIIEKRKKIKKLTTQNRRLNHQSQAA